MEKRKLIRALAIKKEASESSLERRVMCDILAHLWNTDEEMIKYLQDVIQYGCSSGVCSSLIYTQDCRQWVREYIDDVLEVYNITREGSSGIPTELDVNYLAWLSYEFTCTNILAYLNDYAYNMEQEMEVE